MNLSDIIFQNIKMKNFKCFSEMEMDFDKNEFIIITGNNGKGKTTIIDAISYALYDKPLNENILADSIVNKKANKDCSVILKFKIGNDSYRIERYRKHRKYKDSKFLFKNEKDISGSSIEETNKTIKTLVYPKDVFLSSIVFTPHSKKTFISSKYPEQKDIIDKMLSLEIYDTYLENSKLKIKNIEEKINTLNNELLKCDFHIDNFKTNIKEEIMSLLNNSRKTYHLNKSSLISKYNQLSIDENNFKYDIDEESLLNLNIDVLKNEVSELNNEISNIENKKNSELIKLENIINKLKNEYRENLKNKYSDKLDMLENEINNKTNKYNLDINKIEKNKSDKILEIIEEKQNVLNKHNNTLYEHDNIIRDFETQKLNMNLNMKSLSKDLDINTKNLEVYENEIKSKKCSACGQKLPVDNENMILDKIKNCKDLIKDIENKLEKYKDNIFDIDHKINAQKVLKSNDKVNHESTIQNIDSAIEEQNRIFKKYTDLLKNKYDEEISSIKDNKNIIEDEMNTYKKKIECDILEKENKIRNNIDVKYKEKLNEFLISKKEKEEKLYRLNIEISEISEKIKRFSSIQNEKEIIRNKIESFKNNYKTNRRLTLDKIYNYKKQIKTKLSNKNKINIKIEDLNKEKSIVEFWKTAFGDLGIKSILFEEAIPILNKKAMELSNLVENLRVSFDSQTKSNSSDKYSNKFSINVVHSRNLSEFNELSAGETRLVHIIILLCLRHLLETMSGIRMNILLLDEMLDSLDEENSKIVIDIIKKLSENYCVMLISHTHKKWIPADREYKL